MSAASRAWSTTSAASRLRRSSGSERTSAAPTSSTPTDPDRHLRLYPGDAPRRPTTADVIGTVVFCIQRLPFISRVTHDLRDELRPWPLARKRVVEGKRV